MTRTPEEPATKRPPGRPARISRDAIVEAVAATANLDTMTVREVAARLQVTHGALYRWVRTRDELVDLVSETLVDRVVRRVDGAAGDPPAAPELLRRLGWAMHDEFLALPGYATHLSRPHRHHGPSVERIRDAVVTALVRDGVDEAMAEQSWQIFVTCTVGWLAAVENAQHPGARTPRFAVFLDVLVRGLPARDPDADRPAGTGPPTPNAGRP